MREDIALRKMQAGDTRSLEWLMDRYIPYVSAIVWNILRNVMPVQDAEEVVSDVFLAAWNQAGDIQPGQVKAWLGAVARNKAKNKLRELGKDLPLEEDWLEIADANCLEERAEHIEQAKLVQKALDTLCTEDRAIFLRHYYYCQTVREISQSLLLNESTVKTRLRRGRMRLKEILTRWDAI